MIDIAVSFAREGDCYINLTNRIRTRLSPQLDRMNEPRLRHLSFISTTLVLSRNNQRIDASKAACEGIFHVCDLANTRQVYRRVYL